MQVMIAKLSKVELKSTGKDGFKRESVQKCHILLPGLKSISTPNGLSQIPHAFCFPWSQWYPIGKLNRNQSFRSWSQRWHGLV